MKRKLLIVFFLIVIVLITINTRTPFFTSEKGGWSVGYGYFDSLSNLKNIPIKQLYSIEDLKKRNDSTNFLADPFFIKDKDTFYLFFEHQKNRPNAEIGLMVSTDGLNYIYKGTVLREPFHLSYPQVFKHKDDYYMLPETQGANNVLLYKAENFPFNWKVCDTLLHNIKLKDPTIYVSDTLNVLFGSNSEMTLFAFESNGLREKWRPHKQAVVKRGTESRCGGRIIPQKDGFILPIQNTTKGYGYGVSLYKVRFNKGNYIIEKLSHLHLKPQQFIPPFNGGMHHLDFQEIDDDIFYAVYDGNTIVEDGNINFNWKGPLKWNGIDLLDWIQKR